MLPAFAAAIIWIGCGALALTALFGTSSPRGLINAFRENTDFDHAPPAALAVAYALMLLFSPLIVIAHLLRGPRGGM